MPVPVGAVRTKGWSGQVIERELGAGDGAAHGPDFASRHRAQDRARPRRLIPAGIDGGVPHRSQSPSPASPGPRAMRGRSCPRFFSSRWRFGRVPARWANGGWTLGKIVLGIGLVDVSSAVAGFVLWGSRPRPRIHPVVFWAAGGLVSLFLITEYFVPLLMTLLRRPTAIAFTGPGFLPI